MAALRNHQFYAAIAPGLTLTTMYTVPAGMLVVLRDFTVQNQGAGSTAVQLRVGPAGTIWVVTLAAYPGATSHADLSTWIAMSAGQSAQINVVSNQPVGAVLSGALYFV